MFKKTVLPNGLTIVLEEISFVRSIALGFWVQNGSRNETEKENGISHFIEHMLFKGTKNRSAKNIADDMDAIGGQMNAFTAKEYTCYYTRVLDQHFDTALDIMSDMFFNSNFADEEIEKERNVIMEEINMYEDAPEDLVHDMLQTKAFSKDALGFPVLGTKNTISYLRHDHFTSYLNKNYCPQNTVVAIAGNFNADEMVKKIEKYFGDFTGNYEKPSFNSEYESVVIVKEKKIEQLHLCLSFPGLPIDSENTYVLSVFNTLFGGGLSSRLFQSIREGKGLVYSIYSYAQSYSGTGLYTIYAALNPAQVGEAFKSMTGEVERVFSDRITLAQIARTKDQMKSSYVLSLESSATRMNSIGRSQLLLGKILTPDEILEKIDAVSYDDIYKVAGELFDFKNMSISAVGRVKNINFEELLESVK